MIFYCYLQSLQRYYSDAAISKQSKLAYVSGGNILYVIDLKDPTNPILLNQIGSANDKYAGGTNGSSTELWQHPRIVEKDGWVYVTDQNGMEVVDLDPVKLKLVEDDSEFPQNALPAKEYYPALGAKRLKVRAEFDSADAGEKDNWGLYLLEKNTGVKVYPVNNDQCDKSKPIEKNQLIQEKFTDYNGNFGYADFCIAWDDANSTPDSFTIKLGAKRRANPDFKEDPQYDLGSSFTVRHNGNVTLNDVLNGTAVFVYDNTIAMKSGCDTTTNDCRVNVGYYRDPQDSVAANERKRRFYYVQEILNQENYPEPAGLAAASESTSSSRPGHFTARAVPQRPGRVRDLHRRNPQRPKLNAPGAMTEKLVNNTPPTAIILRSALIRELAGWYPGHPLVEKWQTRLKDQAAAELTDACAAVAAGDFGKAAASLRRVAHLWPALEAPGTWPARSTPSIPAWSSASAKRRPAPRRPRRQRQDLLTDWAARRDGRLVCRMLGGIGRGRQPGAAATSAPSARSRSMRAAGRSACSCSRDLRSRRRRRRSPATTWREGCWPWPIRPLPPIARIGRGFRGRGGSRRV